MKYIISLREFALEDGKPVDLSKLQAGYVPQDVFEQAHASLVIACHDVAIQYKGGILLVKRDNFPANGLLYPVGGRIQRGVPMLDSLRDTAKRECNLDLEDITELGTTREFYQTAPFNHGKGTDTISWFYFAKGSGDLKLDGLHTNPTIVTPNDYTSKFRNQLDHYVQHIMNMAVPLIK